MPCPSLPNQADVAALAEAAPDQHWRAAAALLHAAQPDGGERAAALLEPLADERLPPSVVDPLPYTIQPAAVYAAMLAAAHATPADLHALWPVAQTALALRDGDAESAIARTAYDIVLLGLASSREGMAAHVLSLLPVALTSGQNPALLYNDMADTGLAVCFAAAEGQTDDDVILQALQTSRGDGSAGLATLASISDRAVADASFAASLLRAAASSGRWSLVSAVLVLCSDVLDAPQPRWSDRDALFAGGLAQGDASLVRWILQEACPTTYMPSRGPLAWSRRGELVAALPRCFLLALAAMPESGRITAAAAAAARKAPSLGASARAP